MLVWIGGAFDPEGYDFNGINRALRCARLCVLPILRPNPKRENRCRDNESARLSVTAGLLEQDNGQQAVPAPAVQGGAGEI
jgi:hypothetical protein